MFKKAIIVGSNGALGEAFAKQIATTTAELHLMSRGQPHRWQSTKPNITHHQTDYTDEATLRQIANKIGGNVDLIIVATGLLHDKTCRPEKSLKDINSENFHAVFTANALIPALIAKHFTPMLNRTAPAYFAALSARVGSIEDNKIGGWYSYRASKAALNMLIKTTAIEVARKHKNAIVVGLHPGTVDTNLSKPFQSTVTPDKLFTPSLSAQKLLEVLSTLTPEQSGLCFAWDHKQVPH